MIDNKQISLPLFSIFKVLVFFELEVRSCSVVSDMFGILFGWRKASKCKKLIKQALCRLKMLKKKRDSIVRQLREDLFELINNGYQQIAFNRVEQLIRDESLMKAYDLIENFCEFILVKFSHIKKYKTCPDDIMEAISSLIFASARCGDFPELKRVRKLFEELYGQGFAMAAVELCPGNLVNQEIKEKLLMKSVLDHEKQRLISEIARDCFHPAILALEYCPDWHQKQVLENGDQTNNEGKEKPKVEDSNAEELEREVISVLDSSRASGSDIVDPQCHSTSSSSLICQSYPNEKEEVCSNSALASSDLLSWKAKDCNGSGWIAAANLEDGLDRENDASSPEFLPFCEETIVYLDDVVELPNPSREDGDLWDQRFFKFKSPVTSMRENVQDGNDQSLIENHDDSNKKSVSERSSQSINGSSRRSTRRERENNSSSHTKKKLMKCCCLSCHSLEQQCYVYSECKTDEYEVVISEKKKIDSYFIQSSVDNHLDNDLSSKDSHHHKGHISWNEDSDEEIESDTNTFSRTKKIKSCEIETVVYDVFSYSHCQPNENKQTNAKPEEFSTKGKHECSLSFIGMQNSFTKCLKAADKYPSHVHPKLPDYDEIAAKFIALKREDLQRKQHQ